MNLWGTSWVNRIWIALFLLWGVFLSGFPKQFTGSPGIRQSVQLRTLLEDKKTRLEELERRIEQLSKQEKALKTNRVVQEREVRRVLGYVKPDEIVFEFPK